MSRRKVEVEVLAQFSGLCQICEEAPATHVDHIYPQWAGGTWERENLQAACERCSALKGGYLPHQCVAIYKDVIRAAMFVRAWHAS